MLPKREGLLEEIFLVQKKKSLGSSAAKRAGVDEEMFGEKNKTLGSSAGTPPPLIKKSKNQIRREVFYTLLLLGAFEVFGAVFELFKCARGLCSLDLEKLHCVFEALVLESLILESK